MAVLHIVTVNMIMTYPPKTDKEKRKMNFYVGEMEIHRDTEADVAEPDGIELYGKLSSAHTTGAAPSFQPRSVHCFL